MNLQKSPQANAKALVSRKDAAAELLRRRAGRTGLLGFTQYTYPEYKADPFHTLIAATLDKVISGEITRLMIFAPPQHGKSELTSIRFPAYWMGKRPHDPVILASYGADLAERHSRKARMVVESEEYRSLFGDRSGQDVPPIQTRRDSRAVHRWNLDAPYRGGMLAVGIGGAVTGSPGVLGLIDDPVENWKTAQSETYREDAWYWYRKVFRPRIWENGAIVLVMCMTGNTPVLMADGTERPLREIRVGDQVATYDKGRLKTSIVQNHKSNGLDFVFRIKTACGKVVYANERHPFLVEEHGQLKWIRLRNLTTAHKIVTVKDKRVNGKERYASLTVARNPLAHEATVFRITGKKCGQMGIVHRPSMRSIDATCVLNSGTESLPKSTMQCSLHKVANALFANNRQETTCAHIGAANCALTTATKRTRSEGFYATIATLPWDTPRQKRQHLPLLHTSDFTTAQIESIDPAGVEEVFDIQVECTENFIANGLVSHNTRWHEDDLAGRILRDQAARWTVLRLPAIAESQQERDHNDAFLGLPTGQPELLGREPGEPLAPSRFSLSALLDLQTDVGSQGWAAEYQGVPRAPEGNRFKRQWFPIVDAAPVQAKRVRYWDKAGSESSTAAYTAGVKLARTDDGMIYIEDVVRGRYSAYEREEVIRQTAELDAAQHGQFGVQIYVEQEPGSGGKESAENTIRNLAGFSVYADRPSGDKDTRLEPFAAQSEAGNVKLVRGSWNHDYIEEMVAIPNGAYRDQGDATAGAFNKASESQKLGWKQVKVKGR